MASLVNITQNKNVRSRFWLELKGPNGNIREVDYEEIPFTFSKEKWSVEAILKSNTNLLTTDGVNQNAIATFFQTSDRVVSEKWDAAIIEQQKEIEQEVELAKNDKLVVDTKGNISLNEVNVARITKNVTEGIYKIYNYTVSDSKGKLIATSKIYREKDLNKTGIVVKLFDGTNYPLEQVKTSMTNVDFEDFEKRMVFKIHAKGYNLSDVSKSLNSKGDNTESIASTENTSSLNIKDAEGYVIDAQNNKLEGTITFEAEAENKSSKSGISNLSSYGTIVVLIQNGKKKTFKAKDGVKFCANDECFLGAQGSEDTGLNNASSELDVLGGSSKFFKIVYEKDDNYILVHNNSPKDFYLKLKKEKKAVYLGDRALFGKRKEDKTKKIFDKYVGCPSIDFSNYDANSIDGLTKLINDFIVTCK